ncbi:MAG: pyridoxamine 5'-phosphate oxidase family protein [Oscillospiraceae bacterium]|nr:pyridoxamine 5'-phosphate oxidase family protein [Oscillospiraceae bacterium]
MYENDGIGVCQLNADDVIAVLEKEKTLTLATSADNRVTTRQMSHVNEGLAVYFQTGAHYLKIQQIKANPNVAMSVGGYELEGVATLIGHPLDELNRFFIEKYQAKHPQYAKRWSALPNQVLVKVEVTLVRRWCYVNGEPVIAIWEG